MVALAELEADTGIDHVLAAADRTANRERRVLIRTVERADSRRIRAAVIAVAHREVPLVIRVEVLRMQGRESSRTGTDAIDAAVHLVDGPDALLELRDIDRIAVSRARSHIVDLLTAHGDIAVCDFHSARIIAVSSDLDAAVRDGRTSLAIAARNGQATVIHRGLARRDTVKAAEVLRQAQGQAIRAILDDTDVLVLSNFRSAARQAQRAAKVDIDGLAIIALIRALRLLDIRHIRLDV